MKETIYKNVHTESFYFSSVLEGNSNLWWKIIKTMIALKGLAVEKGQEGTF